VSIGATVRVIHRENCPRRDLAALARRAARAAGRALCPPRPQRPPVAPPYLAPEAAALLKVHDSTLYRAIQAGRLQAFSVGAAGRAIRIPADELEAFKARRMIRKAQHVPPVFRPLSVACVS
jgi:excisionase family DNA binding protein